MNPEAADMSSESRGGVLVLPETVALERWADPACGAIGWRTLLSAGLTPSRGLTCGIATLEPGEDFTLHYHPQPEVYLALEGTAVIMVDGIPRPMVPEAVLFIPGGAIHGIPPVTARFRYFYCFATDSFSEIAYSFLPPAGPAPSERTSA